MKRSAPNCSQRWTRRGGEASSLVTKSMSAQLISLRCQNCGSSLQISDGLRFVTCAYCKCELAIKWDASTIHTEVLEAIHANTETTVNHLQVIELQNEIERLRSKLTAANADARRYRFARDCADPNALPDMIMQVPKGTDEVFDQAIDEWEETNGQFGAGA